VPFNNEYCGLIYLLVNFEACTEKIRQSGNSGWILGNIVRTNWKTHTHTHTTTSKQTNAVIFALKSP
jgi:hypothetical protein